MKISLCTEKGTSYRFFITNFDGNHNISSMYIILHILIKGFLYFGYKAKINGKINLQHHSVQRQSPFSKLRCFPPPPSTKVPLAQNVCYDDIILLWKWDPGTWGGGKAFVFANLYRFCTTLAENH